MFKIKMAEIRITLETLYDILRNEKKRDDLQRLEPSFFLDVVAYLKEKKSFLESKKNDLGLFSGGEREKMEYELRSIQRILKEIYEKREKKIIDIALNRSRTGSDIIDTSSMLSEEKEFYKRTLSVLDEFRRGILLNLMRSELPLITAEQISRASGPGMAEVTASEVKPEVKPELKPEVKPEPKPEANPEIKPETAEAPKIIKIKFIHPVPTFVWKDSENPGQFKNYGPFSQGEEAELFSELAELIVRKGRAERV